jgi:hypothetical protein
MSHKKDDKEAYYKALEKAYKSSLRYWCELTSELTAKTVTPNMNCKSCMCSGEIGERMKYKLEERIVHGEKTMVKVYPLMGKPSTLTKPRFGRFSTGGNFVAKDDDKRRISSL